MAIEDGEKPEVGYTPQTKAKAPTWQFVVLRSLALCATVSATLVMALNKQTKSIVLAVIGNAPISVTVTAKFQYTPAFVYFVIVNAIASFYNLSLLLLGFFGNKFNFKGLGLLITISDMVMVGLVSSGAAAAASIAELGKNGNSHAGWNKICDNFGTYCDHGGGALIAAFIAVGLLMVLNTLSTINLYKNRVGH